MSRRLLPKERLREKRIDVYLSAEEIAVVEAKAEEAGLRLAEYCRSVALGQRISSLPEANPKIWAALAPLCSNLNQLARHANEGRACAGFCVNGLLAGNCRLVRSHNEHKEARRP